jgi:hypothetical protein
MNNLLNAARLGLEYAEQVLAERKLDLAGCPHKWAQEEQDVAAIRTAIEASEQQTFRDCRMCEYYAPMTSRCFKAPAKCVDGDQFRRLMPVRLWESASE